MVTPKETSSGVMRRADVDVIQVAKAPLSLMF